MKTTQKIALIAAIFIAGPLFGQTNQDLRIVSGKVYDVNNSPRWVAITIPAGSTFEEQQKFHFTGGVIRTNIVFIINPSKSLIANEILIKNFPYNGNLFCKNPSFDWYMTRQPITFRAFQIYHATTNYDAIGRMIIKPPRPIFDYGIPVSPSGNLSAR